MTEPTPKHYRLLNRGEIIQKGDQFWAAGGWSETQDECAPLITEAPYRRPIQSFVEADEDELAFIEFCKSRAYIVGGPAYETWKAALAYARGKKG